MVQPPGIAMPPDMDLQPYIVAAALAMNKSALTLRNAKSRFSPTWQLLIVFIVPSHPDCPAAILIPAFWRHIQIVIMDVEYLVAARVTRITVKNVTALVLIEHAVAFPFRMPRILHGIVEKGFFPRRLFRRKGHVIV